MRSPRTKTTKRSRMTDSYGLVLPGGGARTAYQAGVLRYLGDAFPDAAPSVVHGVGAGALNAALLSARSSGDTDWSTGTAHAVSFWDDLHRADVFAPRSIWDLVQQLVRHAPSARQSLLDATSLQRTLIHRLHPDADGSLPGVGERLRDGWLDALALTTTDYATLRSVTWAQHERLQDGSVDASAGAEDGRSTIVATTLTVDHVRAAVSLALLFPAVRLDDGWHGAGVGALHPVTTVRRFGVDRVLVVSTRPSAPDAVSEPETRTSYPSPLRIASVLSNTLLLDVAEDDAARLKDVVDESSVLVLRPSRDPTSIARDARVDVGAELGTVLQYLDAEGTRFPDLLSVLCYTPVVLRRLLLLGYADARDRHARIDRFLNP